MIESHDSSIIKKRPNILFSTSRMWNPGDEFIMFGIESLLRSIIADFNSIIYNRNPDLHQFRGIFDHLVELDFGDQKREINIYQTFKNHLVNRDNSWHPAIDMSIIDYVIFSGTPEWMGYMVRPLVDALLPTKIPVLYLGIGSFESNIGMRLNNIGDSYRQILEHAKLITVRDRACLDILAPLSAIHLPCPALFSSNHFTIRKNKIKLALSTQGIAKRNGQKINKTVYDYTIMLFRALAREYDCTLVCHYIDELDELKNELGDMIPFAYSYDSKEYVNIYDEFDLAVTTRVHGAGLCASLGIPSFVISHSTRSDTTMGFLAEQIGVNEDINKVINRIKHFNLAEASERLIEHKNHTKIQYLELLRPIFGE